MRKILIVIAASVILFSFAEAQTSNTFSAEAKVTIINSADSLIVDSAGCTVRAADQCVIEADSCFCIQGCEFDAFNFPYEKMNNLVICNTGAGFRFDMTYPSGTSHIHIVTHDAETLYTAIKKRLDSYDPFCARGIITCTGSTGTFFDSMQGSIRLTQEKCYISVDTGVSPADTDFVITDISFYLDKIHGVTVSDSGKTVCFHTCDSHACDKFVTVISPQFREIGERLGGVKNNAKKK